MKNKLLIIGVTIDSAGIGGVSIHLERLFEHLRIKGYSFGFCDYKKESVYKIVKQILQHKVIHIHPSNPFLRLFFLCISKILGKKVLFTVHGNLGRFSTIKNYIDRLAIQWSDIPIVINQNSYDKAIQWNNKVRLISAYIPPISNGYISGEVIEIIKKAKLENKIVVSTNASMRSYTNDGREIYGIDFLIDYFNSRDNYLLCVSDPSSQYTSFYREKNIKNVLFITEKHSFYHVMKLSDVMVRATATDGDSLSIREGLDLNIKVIATDAVSRPEGVMLFKYGDVSSFEKVLQCPFTPFESSKENVVDELIILYNSLL